MIQVKDRQVAEELRTVTSDSILGGDDVEIRILLRRSFVVITRSDVGDVAYLSILLQRYRDDLGVYLVVIDTVEDGTSCILQHFGVVEVVLLVKAGTELHDSNDFLAVLPGSQQC